MLVECGETARGEELIRTALAAAEDWADKTRLAIVARLCSVLSHRRQHEELAERAAELRELADRIADEASSLLADNFANTAATGLGRNDEALVFAERLWRGQVRRHGELHRSSVTALSHYVGGLHQAGKLGAAGALYPQLLAATRQTYGDTHSNTLIALNNHAALLLSRGKRKEAITSLLDIVRIREANGGKSTPDDLTALNNLGTALHQSARFAEAEPILLAEYERLRAMLPAAHPQFGPMHRTIADAYEQNGAPDEAATWRARR